MVDIVNPSETLPVREYELARNKRHLDENPAFVGNNHGERFLSVIPKSFIGRN